VRHKSCAQTLLRSSIWKYCLNSIKWNDIEVDMPKVRGIKHNFQESSTSPETSPNMEVSFNGELCVKCNEPVTAEFLGARDGNTVDVLRLVLRNFPIYMTYQ